MPRALLKFRRLLEKHNLNEQLFAEVGRILQGSGMTLKTDTGYCRDQTTVGFYQSTLPRLSQECRSRIYRAGIGEYLLVSKSIDGTGAPIASKWRTKSPRSSLNGQNNAG